MKPNNVFLFYYSLVATTILLLASFFILPRPQNIANTILLAPVVFFLWTHALNPDFFTVPRWSPKLGAISLVFCILGIFAYFLSTKFSNYLPNISPLTSSDPTLQDLKQSFTQSSMSDIELRNYLEKEIASLSSKIDSLGKKDLNILGLNSPPEDSTPPAIGQITAKDENLTDIAIYEGASQDSKVVGSAKYGVTYSFYEKNESWYKITEGWVEARWFMETNP